jgi:hypothetical protein
MSNSQGPLVSDSKGKDKDPILPSMGNTTSIATTTVNDNSKTFFLLTRDSERGPVDTPHALSNGIGSPPTTSSPAQSRINSYHPSLHVIPNSQRTSILTTSRPISTNNSNINSIMATPRVLSPQAVAQQNDGQYPERMSWAERLEEAEAASRLRMEQRQMKKRLKDPTEREGLPLGIFGIGSEEEVVENDDESSLFE